ncbi:MAG: hypothetical protein IPK75_05905 [Acidobacteria bacterium]|nr:hypothetical protein [Acidobacteriota bacterium]
MSTDERILHELVRLLGSVPSKATFRHDLPQNHEWLGAVLHIVGLSGDIKLAMEARSVASKIHDVPVSLRDPQTQLIVLLQQMKREFEFKLGYSIPRNYLELSDVTRQEVSKTASALKLAVEQDNEIDPDSREILVSEIAIFEASLGVARLSPEIISRFVNGILRGAMILAAGEVVKKIASDLTKQLFDLLGWPLSG